MYGVYTAGDYNFFAGIVASINSLRFHGYAGPVAVIDTGMEAWMADYLRGFERVEVLSLEPLRRAVRFTDVKSDQSPVDTGWAYKAFGIVHYERFDRFTFIDGDFLPLCNLQQIIDSILSTGAVVCTEDGTNCWTDEHAAATGVTPGSYMNVNAGFLSFTLADHQHLLCEWRNLMTRRKPFDLWYGDQGAINVVLDKHAAKKHVLNKVLWNQTHLNSRMAAEDAVEARGEGLRLRETGERVYAWHGSGWHKPWHCIGIDHYRSDAGERRQFHKECGGKVPEAVLKLFQRFLFCGDYNRPLVRDGHRLRLDNPR
jgi:hypothetical protein